MKRAVFAVALWLLIGLLCFPVAASDPVLVDTANLLSAQESADVTARLESVREQQAVELVVVTVSTLRGQSARSYAENYYDSHEYGCGADRDGVLLLVDMDSREWWICTTGFGKTALTSAGIDAVSEAFLSDLSDGDYAAAFFAFADGCERMITLARQGTPYEPGSEAYKRDHTFPWWAALAIAAGVGVVAAFVTVEIMRRQLKSVRPQRAAGSYVQQGSLQLNEARDLFLYSQVTRVRVESNPPSGGGGGHSSGGSSHGGGGGHF